MGNKSAHQQNQSPQALSAVREKYDLAQPQIRGSVSEPLAQLGGKGKKPGRARSSSPRASTVEDSRASRQCDEPRRLRKSPRRRAASPVGDHVESHIEPDPPDDHVESQVKPDALDDHAESEVKRDRCDEPVESGVQCDPHPTPKSPRPKSPRPKSPRPKAASPRQRKSPGRRDASPVGETVESDARPKSRGPKPKPVAKRKVGNRCTSSPPSLDVPLLDTEEKEDDEPSDEPVRGASLDRIGRHSPRPNPHRREAGQLPEIVEQDPSQVGKMSPFSRIKKGMRKKMNVSRSTPVASHTPSAGLEINLNGATTTDGGISVVLPQTVPQTEVADQGLQQSSARNQIRRLLRKKPASAPTQPTQPTQPTEFEATNQKLAEVANTSAHDLYQELMHLRQHRMEVLQLRQQNLDYQARLGKAGLLEEEEKLATQCASVSSHTSVDDFIASAELSSKEIESALGERTEAGSLPKEITPFKELGTDSPKAPASVSSFQMRSLFAEGSELVVRQSVARR